MAKLSSVTKSNPVPTSNVATSGKLRRLSDDETFSPTAKMVEPGMWEVRTSVAPHGVNSDKSLPSYEVIATYDFRGANAAEVQKLALRGAIIDMQRNWRDAYRANVDTATNAATWANVDVKKDVVDATRAKADPVARARTAINKSGMTKDQLLALIATM